MIKLINFGIWEAKYLQSDSIAWAVERKREKERKGGLINFDF